MALPVSVLTSFQTVLRENIVVSVGQTTPIDLTMKVASLAEAVTVTGESPVVDTTSANVSVLLSQKLLQSTPGGRDIWSLVEYKVPGLISSRPDVGGTSGGLQGAMVARGTPNSQNAQFLNGVNVGDPSAEHTLGPRTASRRARGSRRAASRPRSTRTSGGPTRTRSRAASTAS